MNFVIVVDVVLSILIVTFAIILAIVILLYKKSIKVKDPAENLTDPKVIKKDLQTRSKDLRYYFPGSGNEKTYKEQGSSLAKLGMIMLVVTILIAIIILIVINAYYFGNIGINTLQQIDRV